MDMAQDFYSLFSAHWWLLVLLFWAIGLLAISSVQAVMKDIWMRDQTDLIHKQVGALAVDVRRLGERMTKLQTHFSDAETDRRDVLNRGERIRTLELPPAQEPDLSLHPGLGRAANNR